MQSLSRKQFTKFSNRPVHEVDIAVVCMHGAKCYTIFRKRVSETPERQLVNKASIIQRDFLICIA